MLDDGTYDAFIVWAEQRAHAVALECTITTGAHKGAVINIVTSNFANRDPFDLVGLPCTLHIDGEQITVSE
jgi:hypothetical protein